MNYDDDTLMRGILDVVEFPEDYHELHVLCNAATSCFRKNAIFQVRVECENRKRRENNEICQTTTLMEANVFCNTISSRNVARQQLYHIMVHPVAYVKQFATLYQQESKTFTDLQSAIISICG